MSVLITRPDHDDTVSYLFSWSGIIIKKAEDKGLKVIDCWGDRAKRKMVEEKLKKQNQKS